MKLRVFLVLVLAAVGGLSCFVGCGAGSSPSGGAKSSSPASPREELLAVAKKLEEGPNVQIGRGKLDELLAVLPASEVSTPAGRRIRADLGEEYLRLGRADEAITVLDEAVVALDSAPSGALPDAKVFRVRALAHLRKAELENCVNRHNRDCCIAPLQAGGVHAVSEPARRAKADYIRYLDALPAPGSPEATPQVEIDRIAGKWLLNIACMALGESPPDVPARHRVPASTFAAEDDIGRFVDVATQLGVDAFDQAGGAIVDDFDGDGFLDIVSSTCLPSGAMKGWRNRGDGTFEDVAAAWKLDQQVGGLHIVGGDYDNDGDLDILVPRGAWWFEDGRIRKSLLRNDGAAGFTDVSQAAGMLVAPPGPSQAAVWADFDNDGLLDLYVGHESRVETVAGGASHPSQLFHNKGDGTFEEVAAAAGVRNDRYAKGVAAGDYDNDGDMDLVVSNIGTKGLYRNDGAMKFVDVAAEMGIDGPENRSFATWFFDYDEDGDLDLWINAYTGTVGEVAASAMGLPHDKTSPRLYRNDGTKFTNVAKEAHVDKTWLPMGSGFGDFDNDGWLDIYLGTGDPSYESIMPNVALRNDRGRRFFDITTSSGLGHLQKGHSVCFADFDDDGDQDLYHQLGGLYPGDAFRNALFLNPGHGHHFVTIELVGDKTNRAGVGARLTLRVDGPGGSRAIHRAAGCVSSFGQAPRRQEVGLGDATAIREIEIWWPASGTRSVYKSAPLDSNLRIREGATELEVLPPKTPISVKPVA